MKRKRPVIMEVHPGTHINEAHVRALKLAREKGSDVEFDFNGKKHTILASYARKIVTAGWIDGRITALRQEIESMDERRAEIHRLIDVEMVYAKRVLKVDL